jgi:MFS family permease
MEERENHRSPRSGCAPAGWICGHPNPEGRRGYSSTPSVQKQECLWLSNLRFLCWWIVVCAAILCKLLKAAISKIHTNNLQIPVWFQAIKGVSPVKSGIMNLPMILGMVLFSILTGVLTTVFGYYTPYIYCSIVCLSIGAGLCTTFQVNSGAGQWIGYQLIFGAGIGFGMQQTLIAIQSTLPAADVPIGTAIMIFSQMLGGSLTISVAGNVLANQLVKNLSKVVPGLDPMIVVAVGATQLKEVIPKQFYDLVLVAYNKSLTQMFYTSVALAALSILGAVWIEWKSVKGMKIGSVAAV